MADGEKNTKRGALQAHLALVRDGHLLAARKVYHLLSVGSVSLGLSDDCFEAELALEGNGFQGSVLRNGGGIKFSIWR